MAENTNKENKKIEDDPFDTGAVAIKSFNKAIEKNVQDMTSAGLQSGVNPQELLSSLLSTFNVKQQNSTPSTEDILNTVLSLSETPIPTGEKMNRVASLFRGHGFQRTDITQPLGVDDAIDVIQLQNTMQESEQDAPKKKAELIKILQDIITSTPEGAAEFERSKLKAKSKFEQEERQEQSKTDINSFIEGFEIAEQEIVDVMGPEALQTGPGGKLVRGLGSIANSIDLLPKSSAFIRNIEVSANQMARTIEGGRVTDQDRAIYSQSLANSLTNPSAENTELLVISLRNLRNKGGNISQQVKTLLRSKSKTLSEVGRRLASKEDIMKRKAELLRKQRGK